MATKYVEITNHAEQSFYKRVHGNDRFNPFEVLKEWFHEAVPVGCGDNSKKARIHPPSDSVIIYDETDTSYVIITLYPYGANVADLITMDHLAVCDTCEKLLDPSEDYDRCPWCDAPSEWTSVKKLDDHPSQATNDLLQQHSVNSSITIE